jgi:Tfp pilus assembly protein PilP
MKRAIRVAIGVGVLLVAGRGAAQQPPSPAAQGQPAAKPGAGNVPVEPQGFEYNPEGRRDPFVSLVRRGTETQTPAAGARGPGLAGLEAAEVTLRGTLQSRDGFVGILQGADNRTYIVRVGDKLADGAIRAITANSLVIVQQVNDPLSLEKQREVVKTIRADEAAK